jgi:hypothetical protein
VVCQILFNHPGFPGQLYLVQKVHIAGFSLILWFGIRLASSAIPVTIALVNSKWSHHNTIWYLDTLRPPHQPTCLPGNPGFWQTPRRDSGRGKRRGLRWKHVAVCSSAPVWIGASHSCQPAVTLLPSGWCPCILLSACYRTLTPNAGSVHRSSWALLVLTRPSASTHDPVIPPSLASVRAPPPLLRPFPWR